MMLAVAPDLPIAGPPDPARTERADAARNRARILEVTAALIAERGIEHVSMQDVAEAAGVGTGTLYRRFGDRAGLALALLDAETIEFQNAFLHGEPPLGPGAAAAERLRAFGRRWAEILDEHADLIRAGDRPGAGPVPTYVVHLSVLLREAAPHVDPEFTAHSLLAGLGASQFLYTRRSLGWSLERVQDAWCDLVDAICVPS